MLNAPDQITLKPTNTIVRGGNSASFVDCDLTDVQQLIEQLDLPADLSERLDSSVHPEYVRLWRLAKKSREEEAEDR